jgi:hypothetical protein
MKKTSKINPELIQNQLLPKRIDKTLDWLIKSRDGWKEKCLKAKLELKMRSLSVKRLRDGRDKWKYQSKQAATIIQQMENTLEECFKETQMLKKELNRKNNEIENLKKKPSFLAKS